VCVLDPVSGLLVAGDALVGADGGVGGPNPDFTPDLDAAYASVRKLAGLQFETVVFGHGEPVAGGAAAAVAALAESL
jgi:glyoxylase-like metal-dependent hydrolase (beta-lactamase superfamily II)